MTFATTTDTLTDTEAAAVLVYALHSPDGITSATAAAALDQTEQWVLDQPQAIPGVAIIGWDRTGLARYQAAGPIVSDVSLLAGALLALAEHDWAQGEYQDDLGRVDITGALRLAAGVHPEEEMPGDPRVLDALLAAEDRLACELGYDPALVDAGDTIAAWQDRPARSVDQVRALLLDVVRHTAR